MLATLYTDRSTGTVTANPVQTDNFGNLSFYAVARDYDVTDQAGDLTRTVTVTVQPHPLNAWTGS